MNVELLSIKTVSLISTLIGVFYSLKNYRITCKVSEVWLYLSLTFSIGFTYNLLSVIEEFYYVEEISACSIFLLPIIVVFLLVATITIKRSVIRPPV